MRIYVIAFTLAIPILACADGSIDLGSPHLKLPSQEFVLPPQGFFYVRFAAGESNIREMNTVIPGVGLGYRRLAGSGAADISVNGVGISEYKSSRFFWTAPKASYYHYLTPQGSSSFYAGGGLAWGGVNIKDKETRSYSDKFLGLIPSATVGYELAHNASFLGFSEISLSQPALPVKYKGSFPGPIVEFSLGMGF